jgi:hypothetical protein
MFSITSFGGLADILRTGKLVYQPTPMSLPNQQRQHLILILSFDLSSRTERSCESSSPSYKWAVEAYLTPFRKKWTLDANAVAQEKGIEAVLAIVQYSGESSSR